MKFDRKIKDIELKSYAFKQIQPDQEDQPNQLNQPNQPEQSKNTEYQEIITKVIEDKKREDAKREEYEKWRENQRLQRE